VVSARVNQSRVKCEDTQRKKETPKIIVVGSLHTDFTVKAKTIPRIGETILGDELKISPGGKGANQAVAATRLGANVTMIGRVGRDIFGRELVKNAKRHNINTEYVVRDPEARTGLALIMVDRKGNNIIAVAPGADSKCCKEDVDRADSFIRSSDVLLAQLETPLPVVEHAINKAFRCGAKVILNPAPACELPERLLRKVDNLTPNEREAEVLSGVQVTDLNSAKKAAAKILKAGTRNVVLTMGKEGALIAREEKTAHARSPKVNPVDTTGAGTHFAAP
jgi:ribokinase